MAGLFGTSFEYNKEYVEGYVIDLDPKRYQCTIRSIKGQILREVCWLSPTGGSGKNGMHFAPNVGDRVVVNTSLSYPLILGCLPNADLPSSGMNTSTGVDLEVDAGHDSSLKNGYTNNPNKPSDFAPGDIVQTNDSGGIMGLLAHGTAIMKASPLARILVSRFGDLVRIVASNFERFSDVGQQTVANVNGRLYEFLGWDRNFENSKVGLYELKDIIGDVAAGEFFGGEPNPDAAAPSADNRVRKYSLSGSSGNELMTEVLTDDGKVTVTITGGGTTTETHSNASWSLSSAQGTTSTVTIVPSSITLNYNGAGTVVLDASGIKSDFGGHYVHIDSGGVHFG